VDPLLFHQAAARATRAYEQITQTYDLHLGKSRRRIASFRAGEWLRARVKLPSRWLKSIERFTEQSRNQFERAPDFRTRWEVVTGDQLKNTLDIERQMLERSVGCEALRASVLTQALLLVNAAAQRGRSPWIAVDMETVEIP
jgi:hypothetical protein